MSADLKERLVGASVWEQNIYSQLKSHLSEEVSLLSEYATAAESTTSRAFAYVVGLLMEDERQHHRLMEDLISALEHDAEFRPGSPKIPYLDLDRDNRALVKASTQTLLQREREDAKSLKRLSKELRGVADCTLWSLLVSNMRRDTDKHISVLKFVLQRLNSADYR